jgi:hypothetical protein
MFSSDSSNAYATMLEKLEEIERALDIHDMAPIKLLTQDLDRHLEQIKPLNSRKANFADDSQRMAMEKILHKNRALTARVQEIMALLRVELSQIKQGRETAKGYASNRSTRTGSIINSAN